MRPDHFQLIKNIDSFIMFPAGGEAAAGEGPAAEAEAEDMNMKEVHESELGVPPEALSIRPRGM